MKKSVKFGALLLALTTLLSAAIGLTACGKGGETSVDQESLPMKAITPKSGEIVVLANDEVAEFVTSYAEGASAAYADHSRGDHYEMKELTLSWEAEGTPEYYELYISENEDMSGAVKYESENTAKLLSDLFVSTTYYWQTYAVTGETKVASGIHTFTTAKTPRTITIEGVSNTRDIGGYATADGKQVKQGMAYRGAYLDEITEQGLVDALATYEIVTDLDLREGGEGTAGGVSPLGEDVQYVQYSCPYYLGTKGLQSANYQPNLAQAIKVFADEDNYPVFYHCSVGRDRTGMVSMLLLGILGASREDIFLDYEMSFFSARGTLDGASPLNMVTQLRETYYWLNSYGETMQEYSFAENCAMYLLDIGVTEAEIASIRKLLLENK